MKAKDILNSLARQNYIQWYVSKYDIYTDLEKPANKDEFATYTKEGLRDEFQDLSNNKITAKLLTSGINYATEIKNKYLNKRLTENVIKTNKSVQSTNKWLKTTGIISTMIAAITGFYIVRQAINDANKNPSHTDTLLQKTLLLLDSMQQFQKGIDSSLRKAVKDSFYASPTH